MAKSRSNQMAGGLPSLSSQTEGYSTIEESEQ
jgi:hypothetical protein